MSALRRTVPDLARCGTGTPGSSASRAAPSRRRARSCRRRAPACKSRGASPLRRFVAGRRYARRASVERIVRAHAGLVARLRGPAREDALPARRLADAARVERPRNRHAVERGLRSRRPIAVVAGEIRLPLGLDERRRPLDERHLHDVRSARDARPEVQVRIGRLFRRVLRRDVVVLSAFAAPAST